MLTWKIGAATVTRIEEQVCLSYQKPELHFPGFEREVLQKNLDWLVPNHYSPAHDCMVTSFHSWLIRTPGHTILLDCCSGNHKPRPWVARFNMLDTPYMSRLKATGVSPEDIDIVVCTHLHADHVGWNTVQRDGRWVPTFPNAKYLFSKIDAEYWNQQTNPAMKNDHRRVVYEDSVLPVVESGQAVLVDGNHEIDSGLMIEPAPGHTPGLVTLNLDAAKLARSSLTAVSAVGTDTRAIFCGDVLHHPLQICAPQWAHMVDEDPGQAKLSRKKVLEQCVESGALLFPAHFGAPHVVRVEPTHGGFSPKFISPE
ncbi:MAG: MBL fold metallo-hydrolase [Burkholderiales bacterium]